MTLVAGYVRISLHTDESTSVEGQAQILTRWAEAHGHTTQLYTDEGYSGGKNIERPAFERMRLDIQAGAISKVVVKSIDRLGRNLKRFVDFDLECKQHGASIFAIEQNLDTGQATGKMMLSLLSIFAEHEADQIGQRMKTSVANRLSQGRAIGKAPLGYRNVTRDGGKWREIDPQQALIVRALVESVIAGETLSTVAKMLNDQNMLPESGKSWVTGTVGILARNPQIVGMRKNGDGVFRDSSGLPVIDTDLQIISLSEWQALESALAQRTKERPQSVTSDRLLLFGLACCAACGGTMRRARSHNQPSYRCSRYDAVPKCEAPVSITAKNLDDYVLAQVEPLLDLPAVSIQRERDPVALQKKQLLDAEVTLLTASMGTLPPGDVAEAAVRLTALMEQRDAVEVTEIVTRTGTDQTLRDWWHEDKRSALFNAIEKIYVTRNNRLKDRVTIHWHEDENYAPAIAGSTETGRIFKSQGVHGNEEVPLALPDSEASKLKTLDRMTAGTH